MKFGFSYIGLIWMLLLTVPNLLWTRCKPAGYEQSAKSENRVLLTFERIGEVAVSCLALLFSDFNPHGWEIWIVWWFASLLCMVLYEIFWIRYFLSAHTMCDFYRSLLGIPVAGATLPVAAFALLAIYGKNPLLFAAVIVLGIGHIGIHLGHLHALNRSQEA